MSKSFEDILNQIATDAMLHTGLLYNLSKMSPEALGIFKQAWPTMATKRRRAVMQELMDITEANFEVDFNPVFLLGMADDDEKVRATAIKSLWEYEHPDLIRPLIHLLKTDESVMVKEAAATALGQFIYLRELEEIDWGEATLAEEALLETIYHPTEDANVKRRAVESIGFSGEANIAQIIENAYYDDNDKMRISAIFAMGRNADARWIPWLIKELDNGSAEFRFEAARACGELEAKAAVDKLVILVDDEDLEVREMAVWALGRIGGDTARKMLEACAESDDEALAVAAEAALDEINLFDNMLLYDFDEDVMDDDNFIELYDDDDLLSSDNGNGKYNGH